MEIKANILKPAVGVGNIVAKCTHYMVEQALGGGWADLGRRKESPPSPANVQIFDYEHKGEENDNF